MEEGLHGGTRKGDFLPLRLSPGTPLMTLKGLHWGIICQVDLWYNGKRRCAHVLTSARGRSSFARVIDSARSKDTWRA